MENKKQLTGIILCGGKSSRMGSNKALLNLNGKYIISHVIDVLSPFCDEIIISTNNSHLYSKFNFKCIADEKKNIGPIGGIYTLLNNSVYQDNIILSCDIPFVEKEFIKYLLDNYNGETALIPQHDNGKAEPLCAVYNKSILKYVNQQIANSDFKLMNLLSKSNANFLSVDEWEYYTEKLFSNLNSMNDIEGVN